MIKIFLCFVLVGVATLIGFCLAERLKVRKQIFEELIVFNNSLMCDIGLFQSTIIDALHGADGLLKNTFSGAGDALKCGRVFSCKDLRLKEAERRLVSDYINGLGLSDAVSQKNSLKLYEEKLKSIYLAHENHYQKSAKLYTRLGFSFGLIVAIILF